MKRPFTNIDGSVSEVDMMSKTIRGYDVVETPSHTALALAYKGNDFAMVIAMPQKGHEVCFWIQTTLFHFL